MLKNKLKDAGKFRALADISSLGLTLVFSTFIGFGIGFLLDKLFHTRPFLMLIFLILGIIAGFVHVFRVTKSIK